MRLLGNGDVSRAGGQALGGRAVGVRIHGDHLQAPAIFIHDRPTKPRALLGHHVRGSRPDQARTGDRIVGRGPPGRPAGRRGQRTGSILPS
eukprot:2370815-Pyramimonas_sp.AAC.1